MQAECTCSNSRQDAQNRQYVLVASRLERCQRIANAPLMQARHAQATQHHKLAASTAAMPDVATYFFPGISRAASTSGEPKGIRRLRQRAAGWQTANCYAHTSHSQVAHEDPDGCRHPTHKHIRAHHPHQGSARAGEQARSGGSGSPWTFRSRRPANRRAP